MTILDGLKKLYVKLGGTIDSKHSYDDIGRLMEDVADVVNNSPGIPEVTSDDDGKVLKVIDGEWNKGTDDGLPEVTSDDNDKIMKVINGVWGKGEISDNVVIYELIGASNIIELPEGVTHTQIVNDIDANKLVLLKHQKTYFYPSYRKNDTSYCFSCVPYVDTRARFGVNGQTSYLVPITGTNNKFSRDIIINPNLPVAESNIGKILSVISQGTYGLIDPPLPAVTADDNGDVLGVVNGAWAKMDAPSGGNELVLKGTVNGDHIITFEDEVTYQTIKNALNEGKRPILELTDTEHGDVYIATLANYIPSPNDDYFFTCTSVEGGGLKQYYTDMRNDPYSPQTNYYWNDLS